MKELVRVSRDESGRVYRLKEGYVKITPSNVEKSDTIRSLTSSGSWRMPTEEEKETPGGRSQRIPAESIAELQTLAAEATYLNNQDRVRLNTLAYAGKATVSDAQWLSETFSTLSDKVSTTLSSAPVKWAGKIVKTLVASAFNETDTYFLIGDDDAQVTGVVAVTDDGTVLEYDFETGQFVAITTSLDEYEAPFIAPAEQIEAEEVVNFLTENPGTAYDISAVDPIELALYEMAEAGLDFEYLDTLESIVADAAGYSSLERSRNSRRQRRRPDGTFGPGRYATMPRGNNNNLNRKMRLSQWHRARLKKLLPQILAPGQNIQDWIDKNPALWNARTLKPIRASAELTAYEPGGTDVIIALVPSATESIHDLGPEDKHITLAYLGETSADELEEVKATAQAVSELFTSPLTYETRGTEEFDGGAKVVLLDRQEVLPLRTEVLGNPVVARLDAENNSHPEFNPHITIGYGEAPLETYVSRGEIPTDITFDRVSVWAGDEHFDYPIGATDEEDQVDETPEETDTEQAQIPSEVETIEEDIPIVADASVVEEEVVEVSGEEIAEEEPTSDETENFGALYYAVVDDVDEEAVFDVIAILPDANGNPTAWVRRGSEWVFAEDFINEFNSSTPPPVVQLEDEETIKDVLGQIDSYDTENPDQLDALSVETADELVASVQALKEDSTPEQRNYLRLRSYALGRPDAIPTTWWELALADLGDAEERSPLFTETGEILPVVAAGIPGIADTPSDWAAVNRLKRYWKFGAGAAKIRWNTPGDLTRCNRHLSKYMPGRAWSYCNTIYKEAFGEWHDPNQ